MARDTEREAIIRAAREVGIEPALALAIAERESSFNPRARNSKTIRGMYQMRGDHRAKYGIGDSDDPYQQTKGWGAFFKEVQKEMAGKLGRDPSGSEGYLGHHFGGARAGRMLKMDPNTTVDQVFTPREMRENPHFAKAGTVGRLNSSILADIDKRQAKFGGAAPDLGLIDFAKMGEPVELGFGTPTGTDNGPATPQATAAATSAPDFSRASNEVANLNTSAPAASSAPDFSQFGVPA
jgi:hypothetical protein